MPSLPEVIPILARKLEASTLSIGFRAFTGFDGFIYTIQKVVHHGEDQKTECIVLGIAASGAYIQNGLSPGLGDLMSCLKTWREELKIKKEPFTQDI